MAFRLDLLESFQIDLDDESEFHNISRANNSRHN